MPTTTLLVPAAGFGLRMGAPPAKELMPRPGQSKPLIDWPIQLAKARDWECLIISRRDKTELNQYIEGIHKISPENTRLYLIESSSDWFDSCLQSQDLWKDKVILVLPDTQFSPENALDEINNQLDVYDLVVAHHEVVDIENWGHIWTEGQKLFVQEKPQVPIGEVLRTGKWAWGVLGFRKPWGSPLLRAQEMSQKLKQPQKLDGNMASIRLEYFTDLTRPGRQEL